MLRYPQASTPPPERTTVPVLGGRAASQQNARTQQIFGRVGSTTADEMDALGTAVGGGWTSPHRGCERLWHISSTAMQVVRVTADGAGPVSSSTFLGGPLPAGASRGGQNAYKLACNASGEFGQKTWIMDVGQSAQIYAKRISVTTLGTAFTVEVPTDIASVPQQTGMLVDALVGVSLTEAEAPLHIVEPRLTEHLFVAAGTRATIRVPPFAVAIKAYKQAAGGVPGPWERHLGDPALTSRVVGEIDFAGVASTDATVPVGDESFVRTDQDNLVDRLFTLVWTIKPSP